MDEYAERRYTEQSGPILASESNLGLADRTCAADSSCVLCVDCFQASDHDGHEVLFGQSYSFASACDCGDPTDRDCKPDKTEPCMESRSYVCRCEEQVDGKQEQTYQECNRDRIE